MFVLAGNFTLTSSDLGGQLTKKQEFNGFGCNGKNVSPELSWSGVPKGTKSFAITVYDPDAPTGSGWWHWIAVNIPANATSIPAGASGKSMPKGTLETVNDFGSMGFGGACPPKGDKPHRYIFTVYALDVDKLPVKASTKPPVVGYQINAHAISKASIVSYYGR
nr:YbhB/YbcL family Raf kinase inhibitor-like protein [Sulfurovum lithotrophicum]